MKKMKKFAGILCTAALAAVMGLTAFASGNTTGSMPEYTSIPFDGTVVSVENERLTMNRTLDWGTDELIVNLTEETKILDAMDGYPVTIDNLNAGEAVRVYTEMIMTMSLPPITNGVVVLCNLPADAGFPIYTNVREMISKGNGSYTLTTVDGTVVTVNENTTLLPYLTRNIVRAEDLVPGSAILLWTNAADPSVAYKIVMFQNGIGYGTVAESQTAQGWKQEDEGWYYYEDGNLKKGWFWDGRDWFYLDPETGLMHTGFITLNGKTYFLKEDGRMLTEEHAFTVDENGELHY